MNEKKCCSIILNYNSFNDTKALALKLHEIDEIDEIVIIDNNSTDNSFIEFKEFFGHFEDISIIKIDENLGYSHGNNYGARFLLKNFRPKYILISNPDVEIPKNFVKNMVNYLEHDHNLAAVTGLMLNYENKIIFSQIAWKIPNLLYYTIMNIELLIKFYNPINYKSLKFSEDNEGLAYVECLPGSCFVIRSKIFRQIGFFDDNFFLYCEEVALGRKIKDFGYTNGLSFNNFFIHKHIEKRNMKEQLRHYIFLYRSRLYYIINYTKFGKIFSPIFILTIILGMLEKIIVLSLKTSKEKN